MTEEGRAAALEGVEIARSRLMYWALTDADYAAVKPNPPRPPSVELRRELVKQDVEGFEAAIVQREAALHAAAGDEMCWCHHPREDHVPNVCKSCPVPVVAGSEMCVHDYQTSEERIESLRAEGVDEGVRPLAAVMPSTGAWLDWRPVEALTDAELHEQSRLSLDFVSGGPPEGTLAFEEYSSVLGRGFAIDREILRRVAEPAPVAPPRDDKKDADHWVELYLDDCAADADREGTPWPLAREAYTAGFLRGRSTAAPAPVAVVLGDEPESFAALGAEVFNSRPASVRDENLWSPRQRVIQWMESTPQAVADLDAFQRAIEGRYALAYEPTYSEVLTAAGEAVEVSGDVSQDAQRMEAFVQGATYEYNRLRAAEAERDRLRDAAKRLAMEVHLTTGSPDAVWDAHEAVLDLLDEPAAALEGQGNQ